MNDRLLKDAETNLKKLLSGGRYSDAKRLSGRLLEIFPDAEEIMLLNLAARTSLDGAKTDAERQKELSDALEFLDAALSKDLKRREYFLYYNALALIGLKRADEARIKLGEALALKPGFEKAELLAAAMDAATD
ncbi:MAG: hypothetical protein LBP26_00770 [Clostridiales bacterium]|jgi:tetratricopeptide (TPR) repeat protein|nr:hypothetical protein [Clostridiales bacterium]